MDRKDTLILLGALASMPWHGRPGIRRPSPEPVIKSCRHERRKIKKRRTQNKQRRVK